MPIQNEMSYPLGSAADASRGLSTEYANTVKTFNEIYQQNQNAPFKNMLEGAQAGYMGAHSNYMNTMADMLRIQRPALAQQELNKAKLFDIQAAKANFELQNQYKTLQQTDEQLAGYKTFNDSLSDFTTPDGSYDLQSLTEAQPPSNLTPFQRSGWLKGRDEVFTQAGQADYLNKANQIKQLNAQAELANQANMAKAKQEMAQLGIPLDDDSVNNYLKTVIYPRNKALLDTQVAQQTNPNIVTDAKGNMKVIGGTKGTSANGGLGIPAGLATKLAQADAAYLQGVDAFIDDPKNNGKNLSMKLAPLGAYGVGQDVIKSRQEAIGAVNALRPQLQAASDEILKAEKAANHFFGKATPAEQQAVQAAHAKYDAVHDKMQQYRDVLKQPILSSIGKGATVNPSVVPQGQNLIPIPANMPPEKILSDAAQAIQAGADFDTVTQNVRARGIDTSPLDFLKNKAPEKSQETTTNTVEQPTQSTPVETKPVEQPQEEKPFLKTSEELRAEQASKSEAESAARKKDLDAQAEQEKRDRQAGYKDAEFQRVAEALSRLENPTKYEKGEGTQVGITESRDADIKTVREYKKQYGKNADPKLLSRIETLQK